MANPNDAVNAAKAATIFREPEASKRDRPLSGGQPVSRRRSSSTILHAPNQTARASPPLDLASSLWRQPESPPSSQKESIVREQPQLSISTGVSHQGKKSRARKVSLRKSAIISTSKIKALDIDEAPEMQANAPQQSNHDKITVLPLQKNESLQQIAHLPPDITSADHGQSDAETLLPAPSKLPMGDNDMTHLQPLEIITPRPASIPPPVPMVTHPVHGDPSKILEVTDAKEPFPDLIKTFASTISSAPSTITTTTDDDDNSSITSPTEYLAKKASAHSLSPESYFPPQPPPLRPPRIDQQVTAAPRAKSPLATLPPAIPASPSPDWDYSETRWWGWIILCVTWIVFVVGMGSCFGVWSWAWDVGETPYAPPEFEDDPTLPIVGYYPALIVLTCVMAWVWVTIAWVGMKYFKHANICGDDE